MANACDMVARCLKHQADDSILPPNLSDFVPREYVQASGQYVPEEFPSNPYWHE